MKLTQMKYFSTVCQLGSITKAAEQLYVSQPAVTASLNALEDEIGMPLLYRSRKEVVPTIDGEEFLQRCNRILESVDNLLDDFQQKSASHNFITVGIPPMIGYFLFPQIFLQFKKKYKDIYIKIREAGSETAKKLVKDGELELAIITMGDKVPSGLNAQILGDTQLMYCVDSEHRLAGRISIEMKDVVGDPLILFSSGYYHQQVLQERFQRDKIEPNILFNSNQIMTIKAFVARGIANAFLLPQVVEDDDGIIMLPFTEPMSMHIAVIWRKDAYKTKEADTFIRFIKSRFSQP